MGTRSGTRGPGTASEGDAGSGERLMEATHASITFIVRLNPGGRGRVSGIVERVKTGEKRRFQGAEAVGPLIVAMVEQEAASSPGGDRKGTGDEPHAETT